MNTASDQSVWASASAFIKDREDRVLLVKHTYGQLNRELPGGIAEPGEAIDQTVRREVLEETNQVVMVTRLLAVYYYFPQGIHHFLFACDLSGAEAQLRPGEPEIDDCGYWDIAKLPRPMTEYTARRIKDAISPAKPILPVRVTQFGLLSEDS